MATGASGPLFVTGYFKTGYNVTVNWSGATAPIAQLVGTDANGSTYSQVRFSANTGCPGLQSGKTRGATPGDYSAVQAGDLLYQYAHQGSDGTGLAAGAQIQVSALENFSLTARGTMWRVFACAAGSITLTAAVDFTADGIRGSSDGARNCGQPTARWAGVYTIRVYYSATVFDAAGTGSPEGVVTAGVGSSYRRTDGGAGTSHYIKESGTGNTGWVAK
jgi:hypothetical protein